MANNIKQNAGGSVLFFGGGFGDLREGHVLGVFELPMQRNIQKGKKALGN
jgi:hypothetical protein